MPGYLVWIPICACLPGLPFHCSALPELVSVGVLFTGPEVELKDYVERVHTMYASRDLYVVKWTKWCGCLLSGVFQAVHKPRHDDDDDGDLIP